MTHRKNADWSQKKARSADPSKGKSGHQKHGSEAKESPHPSRHDSRAPHHGNKPFAHGPRPHRHGAGAVPEADIPPLDDVLEEVLGGASALKALVALSKEWIVKLNSGDPESTKEFEALTESIQTSNKTLSLKTDAQGSKVTLAKEISMLGLEYSNSSNKLAPSRSYTKSATAAKPELKTEVKQEVILEVQPEVKPAAKVRNRLSLHFAPKSVLESLNKTGMPALQRTEPNRGVTEAKPVDVVSKAPEVKIDSFVTPKGLVLDPWQKEACDALLRGDNLIIDAPTSAGKTRIIEGWLELQSEKKIRLIYTSPVKSLSNDKYREFSEKYGKDAVGINTGDFKENLSAPIILATLETYRNSLLGIEPNMKRSMVVYDEYHYLQDESRGSAWEESMILTPKESQFLLLSASVPNTQDFATWLESLSPRKCHVIKVTKRPVPLFDLVHTKYGYIIPSLVSLTEEKLEILKKNIQLHDKQSAKFRMRKGKDHMEPVVAPVLAALELGLEPLVLYAGRRADVENLAVTVYKRIPSPTERHNAAEHSEALVKLRKKVTQVQGFSHVPLELQKMISRSAIAFHHSGLIPPGRVAIETLLKDGDLQVCTGTMGISLGVNFAVRSALVFDESRPSEGGDTKYSQTEIMQMLGRAGRRGRDTQGFSLWLDYRRYLKQKPTSRENCESSLKFDPSTVLGILGQRESLSYLSEFYGKSFFLRGRNSEKVALLDHTLLSAELYKKSNALKLPCVDIPKEFLEFQKGPKKSEGKPSSLCGRCSYKKPCHDAVGKARISPLQRIVRHLQSIGALQNAKPTQFGQLARHFPQAGGMIVAHWIATRQFSGGNFWEFLPVLGVFCTAHHKEVRAAYGPTELVNSLQIPRLIDGFYPEELFPELYDDVPPRFRSSESGGKPTVFREFNLAACSIVTAWVLKKLDWESLVAEHESKYFSAGDCMMSLFRLSTFLQSCLRLEDFDPLLCEQAAKAIKILLRDPLDARNRMLLEEQVKVTEISVELKEESKS